MKKALGLICLIVGLCIAFGACSNSDTYADKLKRERKNISRFINENNIVILKEYPKSGVFKENEFFVDPVSGVYINVVDSGNGKRAIQATSVETLNSQVTVRFNDAMTLPAADSDTVSNNLPGLQPISFIYGQTTTYTAVSSSNTMDYIYLSSGIVAPLQYVGEKAKVRLIVPFASGSSYQAAAYLPMYYKELQYTHIY